MSTITHSSESSSPRRVPIVLIGIVAITLIGILLLAGERWPIVAYRLVVEGSVCVLWLFAMFGIGSVIAQIASCYPHRAWHWCDKRSAAGPWSGGMAWPHEAWILVIGGMCSGVVHVARSYRSVRWNGKLSCQWLLATPAIAISLISGIVPPGVLWGDEPNGYDVLEYHLQVPREWYKAGRIAPLPHNVFSFMPFNVEMHYLLAMQLKGGPWAGMYLGAAHPPFDDGARRRRGDLFRRAHPRAGIRRCAWTILLAPVAYDEAGLLLFGSIAIGLAWRALKAKAKSSPRDWILAGVFAGFACGTKLTAAPMLLIGIPVAAIIARPSKILLGWLALFLLAGTLTFSPWLIRNIAWAGNPVFPEAPHLFGRGKFTEAQQQRWQQAALANSRSAIDRRSVRAANQQILIDWRYGWLILPAAIAGGCCDGDVVKIASCWSFSWFSSSSGSDSRIFRAASSSSASRSALLLVNALEVSNIGTVIVVAITTVAGIWNWQSHYFARLSSITPAWVSNVLTRLALTFPPFQNLQLSISSATPRRSFTRAGWPRWLSHRVRHHRLLDRSGRCAPI